MVKKTETKIKTTKHHKKSVLHKKSVAHAAKPVKLEEQVTVKKSARSLGYIFAVGRRKEAVARVRLFDDGQGEFIVNNKSLPQYFSSFEHQLIVMASLKVLGVADKFNVSVKVQGGGKNGQAEAIRLGISRALLIHNPEWRPALKPYGFLTRDARVKERKKPGLKKARRAPQWQKR